MMGFVAISSAPMPIADMVIGQSLEQAVALLPRLFNLCRGAQTMAARLAAGQTITQTDRAAAETEAIRDHGLRLFITLPRLLGLTPPALLPGWQSDAAVCQRMVWGTARPATPAEFKAWRQRDAGLAPMINALSDVFAPGQAVTTALPLVTADTAFDHRPIENSVAGHHADHPILHEIEAETGRGPLWRVVGRMIDIGTVPTAHRTPCGAVVRAPRGTYALRLDHHQGIVTACTRVTPTDHLLCAGGVLEQTLATTSEAGLIPLIMDILDPCTPVQIKEALDA